jgi:hypothetical protein
MACKGEMSNATQNLVETPEEKKLSRRPKHVWLNNIDVGILECGSD